MAQGEMERELAVQAVQQAARVSVRVQRALVRADAIDKADRSPVTVADFAIQAIICRMLAARFPRDPIIAEEESALLRDPSQRRLLDLVVEHVVQETGPATAEDVLSWIDRGRHRGPGVPPRFWTLDPVDGTKGFLRGEQYTIALALLEEGRVTLALMACPNLTLDGEKIAAGGGTVFGAARGRGAWASPLSGGAPAPLRVSSRSDPATMTMTESVEHADHELQGRIARGLGIATRPVRIDSQAKYGIVAAGIADLYLRIPRPDTPGYQEKIWDHAAGSLIIEEAGGRVTDAAGRPLDFSRGSRLSANSGIVASNGTIHDRIIRHLAGG